jgi:hypothetical protein
MSNQPNNLALCGATNQSDGQIADWLVVDHPALKALDWRTSSWDHRRTIVNTLSLQAVTLVASKIEDTLTKCLSYEQRASILDLEDFRITGTKLEERRHSCTELPSTTTFRGSKSLILVSARDRYVYWWDRWTHRESDSVRQGRTPWLDTICIRSQRNSEIGEKKVVVDLIPRACRTPPAMVVSAQCTVVCSIGYPWTVWSQDDRRQFCSYTR